MVGRVRAGLLAVCILPGLVPLACDASPGESPEGGVPDANDDVNSHRDVPDREPYPVEDASVPDRREVGDAFPFEASADVGLGDVVVFFDGPPTLLPEATGFYDVGDGIPCTGAVAIHAPASECHFKCGVASAYLLCDGLFFSRCSCGLPPGYVVVEAGAPDTDGAIDTDAPG